MRTKSKSSVGCLLLTACLATAESQQDFSTPQAAAKSYLTAAQAGDAAAIRNACIGSSEQKDWTFQFLRMCVAAGKLDAASTAKFGREETAEAFRDELKQTAATIPDALAALTNCDVKIDGTNASIIFKAGLTPDALGSLLNLQQVAGKWKVLLDVDVAKPENSSDFMEMVASSMEKCAAEIKADKYKTVAEAQEAHMLAMMTSPYLQKQMTESMEKHPITGQVLDKSGQAVPDARLEVYDMNCRELTPRFTTNSGSDGSFTFPVPRGLGTMAMLLVSKPGFASSWDFWNPYHGRTDVVVLTPPFTVTGTVKDEAGQPVADAEVWIRSAAIQYHRPNSATDYAHLHGELARKCFPPARSGADGRFSIGELPATVVVSLVARKGDKVSETIDNLDTINQLPYYAGQHEILLTIGSSGSIGSNVNQSVFGSTTMTITGIVRDSSGKAVKGVNLMTCPALAVKGGFNPTAKTDANGNYSLAFLVDSLRSNVKLGFSAVLIARDEEHNLAAAKDITNEDATNLDFILQPGLEIAGRVEEPDGHPIAKAHLQLALNSSNHKTQSYLANYFYANSQGSFQISGLPQNRLYVIDARAAGHGLATHRIEESQTATNHIELPPLVLKVADRPLAGQLLDEAGQPVAGDFVFMYGEGQASATVRTDAEGHFSFEKICEGSVNLSANHHGAPGFAKAMAGETNVTLQLKNRSQSSQNLRNDSGSQYLVGSGWHRCATNITLKVVRADSQETVAEDGKAANAVDGKPETFWHTLWQGDSPGHPHEIVIELMPASTINGFTYLPRQDVGVNGTIKDYEFLVSNDGRDFGVPVAKGTFPNDKAMKTVTFEAKSCRFIKLKALSEVNDQPWTSAAEIDVVAEPRKPPSEHGSK